MIKVLFITDKLVFGGVESALYDLIRLMDKSKFDITVFTLNTGGDWENKFVNSGIKVINSYSNLRPSKSLYGKAKNYITHKRIQKSLNNNYLGLLDIVTKSKYDILVLYNSNLVVEPISFSHVAQKRVRWIHCNVDNNGFFRDILLDSKENLFVYDKFICVSNSVREAFVNSFGFDEKTVTCYNPIDYKSIIKRAAEDVGIDLSFDYICTVGRLATEKGYLRLTRIMKDIIDLGINIKLIIVGEGYERKNIEVLIDETHMQDYVLLAGYQENPYPFIKNSLFTVCSSFTEGMPVTSMESLCLGVPVVSAYGPVKELFGNEECGVITENDDTSLRDGIIKMLTDTQFYDKTLKASKRRSQYFSSHSSVREIEKQLIRVLSQ